MGKVEDKTGKRFGRWYIASLIRIDERDGAIYHCLCDCGTERDLSGNHLQSGVSRSCGCLQRELLAERRPALRHGKTHTKVYNSWRSIKTRCRNENFKNYKYWGGRGITVCDKWFNSFVDFYTDIGDIPEGRTLDRINNDGNYEPGNWRFATPKEQANNRRDNKKGEVHPCQY